MWARGSVWRRLVITLVYLLSEASIAVGQGTDIIVTTTADVVDFGGAQRVGDLPGPDGRVSLREAIIAANNTPGPNSIGFNIPTTDPGFNAATGDFTILIEQSPALAVSDNATRIDGRTQRAFLGDASPGRGAVVLRTTPAFAGMAGLTIHSDDNEVLGLSGFALFRTGIVVNGQRNRIAGNQFTQPGSAAIQIMGANNTIGGVTTEERNTIRSGGTGVRLLGSGATGNAIQGNLFVSNHTYGVLVDTGAGNNVIGGAAAGARNVFHSNGHTSSERSPVGAHIAVRADDTLVAGNYVGVDETGTEARPGSVWSGIEVSGSRNTIRGNVVAGHIGSTTRIAGWGAGIRLTGGMGHVIQGNLIGTDATGTRPLPNQYGVKADIVLFADVPRDGVIGGTEAGEANVIAFNTRDGVAINGMRLRVSGNAIFGNGELGINLAADPRNETYPASVTPNDPGDADGGPNALHNFPVIATAVDDGGVTTVRGTIDTPNPHVVTIELYSNEVADGSGHGEGQVFRAQVTPDAQGTFVARLPGGLAGTYVTATATDAVGNTSEFAAAVAVSRSPDAPTEWRLYLPYILGK